MINVLSLFSGTHSWTTNYEAQQAKYKVYSIDIEYRYVNTICRDILTWDYKKELDKKISVIYASPPCNMYFTHMKCPPGKNPKLRQNEYSLFEKELSIKLVNKTIEIIEYYKPKYFIIENPVGRITNHFESILGYKPLRVDYCRYGFNYKKPTLIYTNIPLIFKLCNHKKRHEDIRYVKKRILTETFRAMIPPVLSAAVFDYVDTNI